MPPAARADVAWAVVRRDADLLAWTRAWSSVDTNAAAASVPRIRRLLDDPDIRFLTGTAEGRIVAVAIANRSDDGSGPAVGISNIALTAPDPEADRPGVLAAVRAEFPGLPMVSYDRGDDLVAMIALGFRTLGSLRVWLTTP